MTTKDAHDRGILNHFGILRSPPKVAPSFKAPAPIHVVKGASSGWDRPYVYGAQPNYSKPPHAAEEIVGSVSVNIAVESLSLSVSCLLSIVHGLYLNVSVYLYDNQFLKTGSFTKDFGPVQQLTE